MRAGWAVLAVLGIVGFAVVPSVYRTAHKATYTIDIVDRDGNKGTCSGTAVDSDHSNVIVTAWHCLESEEEVYGPMGEPLYNDKGKPVTRWRYAKSLSLNGKPIKMMKVIGDGVPNDHAIIVTDKHFQYTAPLSLGTAVQGDTVFYFGNPGGMRDLYRTGSVIGSVNGETLMDTNTWYGDSGAGIFDSHGYMVGVVSQIVQWEGGFKLGLFKPFRFTKAQYEAAGIRCPACSA